MLQGFIIPQPNILITSHNLYFCTPSLYAFDQYRKKTSPLNWDCFASNQNISQPLLTVSVCIAVAICFTAIILLSNLSAVKQIIPFLYEPIECSFLFTYSALSVAFCIPVSYTHLTLPTTPYV